MGGVNPTAVAVHFDQVVEDAERRNNDETYELFDNLRELINEMAEQNRLLIARAGNLEGMIEGQNQRIQELTRLNNERLNATDQIIQAFADRIESQNQKIEGLRQILNTKVDQAENKMHKHWSWGGWTGESNVR